MLMYARDFAAEAYPAAEPPRLATVGTCVLCHQPLDGPAQARLAAFDEYVQRRANADAETPKKQFAEIAKAILELKISSGQDVKDKLINFIEGSKPRQALADRSDFMPRVWNVMLWSVQPSRQWTMRALMASRISSAS